jgi:hypothetical protein
MLLSTRKSGGVPMTTKRVYLCASRTLSCSPKDKQQV